LAVATARLISMPPCFITVKVFEKLNILDGAYDTWWSFFKNNEEPFGNREWVEPWLAIQDGSIKLFIKNKVMEILKLLEGSQILFIIMLQFNWVNVFPQKSK
jgi:hypothetical protein